jgi:PAS domain S-box-containing protein
MKKTISIRAKLFILFFIIFMTSIIFLTYMATRIVMQFGEYSAMENETSIRSQASFFLSRMTHEKAMRCESTFERIAVSSASLAHHTAVTLEMSDLLGRVPFEKTDILTRPPGSRLYSNSPSEEVMVLYWGEEALHPGIISRLNALSYMDPLLKNIIGSNPEAVACFITSEMAITRYYPNFSSIIRKLNADAYEIRDSSWYAAVRPENNPDRRTIWSEVYQDPAGRGLMTTALTPLYNANNQFVGVTGVDVTLENIIDKILADIRETSAMGTRDLFSFIVDDTGRIVAFPGEYLPLFGFEDIAAEKQLGYNALLDIRLSDSKIAGIRQLWSAMKAGAGPDQQRILIDNKQLLISSVTMPSTGWRLGVVVPESNLLETLYTTRTALRSMVNTMVFKFGAFALLVMVLSVGGFMILSLRYFIRPLDILTQVAVSVRDGDLSQQVPIERNDEIGILAHTFNTMVSELEKLHLKDKEHALHLQHKVRERTLELEQKTWQQDKTLVQLHQEIRERKQIEERLSKSEEKYRDIFNNSVQGIFQSSHDNRVLNANPAMAQILGYDSIEQFLSTITHLARQVYVNPDDRKHFVELLEKQDFVSGFETQLRKKDGSHVWVSICGRAIRDGHGNLLYIQGSFEDISERKQAQELIKQAKKMAEDASRAKSEFLTIMSHEIRTPLNAIIGMTRLTLSTRLDQHQKEYLDAVLISSDHLLTLLNNILDFSKIEAGKFVLENKPFDIESLLQDMMTMFSFQAMKKQLTLNYVTSHVPRSVKGDMHRLRQILVNLVGNAIKFTNSGSITITLEGDPQTIPAENSREVNLLFSIKDTGVGIPSDKLSLVFNDFAQLNDADAIDSGGTGLGLTITRQLIHLMGGNIWVESEHGQGSTFYFNIRLKTATQKQVQEALGKNLDTSPPSTGKRFTPLKILLAEDFEVNRKLLEPFLAQYSHQVTAVENGKQALEKLSVQRFDIVLMDIKMPVMDGIEATRRIRRHPDPVVSAIPVIALTAHAIKGDRERFLAAGMDEYITKPVHGDELIMMLEQFSKNRPRKHAEPTRTPRKQNSFDLSHALQLMGGNRDIVEQVIKTMIIRFPEEVKKIQAALSQQSFDTITMAAHAMKSGLKSIDAGPLLACTLELEAAAKAKNIARCRELVRTLDQLTRELVRQLNVSLPLS